MIKIIDLFYGLGGFRLGVEKFFKEKKINHQIILSADIKTKAIENYNKYFNENNKKLDVTNIKNENIPKYNLLLASFPCQAFSQAGKQLGFNDTRGTLFFEILRFLKNGKPDYFILENVDNLEKHNKGETFKIIIKNLLDLDYIIQYKILDSKDFGSAMTRKRIFIWGFHKNLNKNFENLEIKFNKYKEKELLNNLYKQQKIKDIIEYKSNNFISFKEKEKEIINLLIKNIGIENLINKRLTNKRGGKETIQTWNIFNDVSEKQKLFLNEFMLQRRKKENMNENGLKTEGYLSLKQIMNKFVNKISINELEDLVLKNHLVLKKNNDKEKYYDFVNVKFKMPYFKLFSLENIFDTITATDSNKFVIYDEKQIRKLNNIEMNKLFGFPNDYILKNQKDIYDLYGNSLSVNITYFIIKYIYNL